MRRKDAITVAIIDEDIAASPRRFTVGVQTRCTPSYVRGSGLLLRICLNSLFVLL